MDNKHEYKEIICNDCYRVSRVLKHIPIRFHWCLACRSLNVRLYKGDDVEYPDAGEPEQAEGGRE